MQMLQESELWLSYEDRLRRVNDYIYDNLDKKIDLLTLGEVACLSPYHWHRVYQAVRGESLAVTVKRLRLQRAAALLAQSELGISAIVKKTGYSSLHSFTRIFNAAYGLPPAEYRKRGLHAVFAEASQTQSLLQSTADKPGFSLEIKNLPALALAAVEHRGSYQAIDKAFTHLFTLLGSQGLLKTPLNMIGIYYDDAGLVREKDLRSQAGIALDQEALAFLSSSAESELKQVFVPAAYCAVLHYQGPYASMHAAYRWLYGTWLPTSGWEPGEHPVYELYLNDPSRVKPADLLTDICLPIVKNRPSVKVP